jgi:hypothetical protein
MTISPVATIRDFAWQSSKHFGGTRKPIDILVLHHNAGTNFNAVPNVWLTRQASAHYQVGPNAIKACLDEDIVAWHAGATNYDNNSHTIGIENVNSAGAPNWPVAQATQENCARLVAEICKRRGIPIDRNHIKGHREMPGCATTCPGGLNLDWIVKRAKEINGGGVPDGFTVMKDPRHGAVYKKDKLCYDANLNPVFLYSETGGREGDYLPMKDPRNGAKWVKSFDDFALCVDDNDVLKIIYYHKIDWVKV